MLRKLLVTGLAAGAAVLAGCDASTSEPSTPPNVTLTGTAAVGAALVNANVSVVGANGITVTTTTNNGGVYTVTVNALTAPFAIRVSGGVYDSDGNGSTDATNAQDLFSVSLTQGGLVNVTPLTTLALQTMHDNADLATAFTNWQAFVSSGGAPTPAELEAGIARVSANLQAQLTAAGVDPLTYDFFTTPFTPNHAGIDSILDDFGCTVTGEDETLAFNCTFDGNPLTYLPTIDISGFNIGGTPGGGGGGGGSCVASNTGNVTLAVTGYMTMPGVPEQVIPMAGTTFSGAAPCLDEMDSIFRTTYSGANLTGVTVNIAVINNTATRHTFDMSFTHPTSGFNMRIRYDYTVN